MKSTLLALLLGSPLLLPTPSVELAFTPEEGDSVTTACETTWVLELTGSEHSITVDGEEQEAPEAPDLAMSLRNTESITFTDEFVEVGEERVLELRRTFDEIAATGVHSLTDPEGEEFETELPGESALESTTVWFRWNEEDQEYSVHFDEEVEDPDDELLEDLEAVADLSWFLPEGEVEEGDRWEIELEAFRQLSALSGDSKLVYEDDDPDDDFDEQFDENLEGETQGELTGFRTVDDRRLAVLHVFGEFSTRVEQEAELEGEEAEGKSSEVYAFTFELEGDLLWDVEAGRAHGFRWSGDVEMKVTSAEQYLSDDHELVFETTQLFEGTITYQVGID